MQGSQLLNDHCIAGHRHVMRACLSESALAGVDPPCILDSQLILQWMPQASYVFINAMIAVNMCAPYA